MKVRKENPPRFIIRFLILEITVFLILSFWYVSHIFTLNTAITKDKLWEIANNVEKTFTYSFDSAASVMGYVDNIIASTPNLDNQKIFELIEIFNSQHSLREIFPWTGVFWSGKEFNVEVDSVVGVLSTPLQNISRENYVIETVKEPGKLKIGKPIYGPITGLKVIPFGMGVTDRQGNYIGTLNSAFEISKLSHSLVEESLLDQSYSFAIFAKDGSVIIESNKNFISSRLKTIINKYIKSPEKGEKFEYHPFDFSGEKIKGLYIKDIPAYDVYVVVVMHDHLLLKAFSISFKKTFYDLSLILSICVILFLFINRFIVNPVFTLAKVAERVVKNERDIDIKEYSTHEINLLADSLRKVLIHQTELIEANEKLEFLLKKLEVLGQAKTEFIRNIQHELRTPLNHVIGGCDILKAQFAGPISQEYLEYVEIIHQSGKELLSKINNIIAVADFEAGEIKLKECSCSVSEIINLALAPLLPKILQNKLLLKLNIPSSLPLIYVDPDKMKTAIFNLINNSIIFNKPNGTIIISVNHNIIGVVIEIVDTGLGIEEANLNKILQIFHADGDMLTKVKRGLGLGLTITQSILNLHDVKFQIESTMDQGTKAIITIPNIRLNRK